MNAICWIALIATPMMASQRAQPAILRHRQGRLRDQIARVGRYHRGPDHPI
jgi:hypothetical protein